MGTFRTLGSNDITDILGAYALTGYRGHTPISAGTVNTNVGVDLGDGRRVFLRVNEGKDRADVQREAQIVAHAARKGVLTPAPLPTADGSPFLTWKGLFVSLFPWVVGRTLGRGDVGPAHAHSVGSALARLHLAGADLADRGVGRYEPDEIDRRVKAIVQDARSVTDPAVAAAVALLVPELRSCATDRHELPMGLIHGDLFIDNTLFGENGALVALLDFEQASWGRLAYDVAVSALAFGYGRDDFRPDVTRAFLDGYAQVRHPTTAERAGFGAELRFAACRFAVTRITDVYLRRAPGAPAGKDFNRYLQRLASVKAHLAAGSGLLTFG